MRGTTAICCASDSACSPTRKSIRQRHLQGVGVVAYGALAARLVPAGRRVVIVGTGALAADLSAALAERHHIDQWGRKPIEGRHGYSMLCTAALGPADRLTRRH